MSHRLLIELRARKGIVLAYRNHAVPLDTVELRMLGRRRLVFDWRQASLIAQSVHAKAGSVPESEP